MEELSPISVSSVMRSPAGHISNVAGELLDARPTPSLSPGGCLDPFSLNHVLSQCGCEVLGQLYLLFHPNRVVACHGVQRQCVCAHVYSECCTKLGWQR